MDFFWLTRVFLYIPIPPSTLPTHLLGPHAPGIRLWRGELSARDVTARFAGARVIDSAAGGTSDTLCDDAFAPGAAATRGAFYVWPGV